MLLLIAPRDPSITTMLARHFATVPGVQIVQERRRHERRATREVPRGREERTGQDRRGSCPWRFVGAVVAE